MTTRFDLVDTNPGDGECVTFGGFCSLRAAIQEINELTFFDPPGEILLPAGVYSLASEGAGPDTPAIGDLDVLHPLDLIAVGGVATIDAQGIDRVMEVGYTITDFGETSRLVGLEIVGGLAAQGGGLFVNFSSVVVLEETTVRDNLAQSGGGVYVDGERLRLVRSVVRDNVATVSGGGVFSDVFLDVFDSSVVGNSAPTGSAVAFLGATVEVVRSTFSGNSGGSEAIYLGGGGPTLQVRSSTIRGQEGAAVQAISTATVSFENSLLVGGCLGSLVVSDDGGNLESPGSTCGLSPVTSVIDVEDPGLRPLAYYGGPTPTLALEAGSPARDIAVQCVDGVDQRAAPRSSPLCDAGSYEFGALSPLPGVFADGFESGGTGAWSSATP